jgi:hypothetical protein
MAVAVAAVDVATLGAHLPYAGWLNYLLPWAVLYQFGIAWQDSMLRGRAALALAAASAVALALLIRLGPYPISMIGVPGAAVNNTSPPNLALLALGCTQAGLVLAAAPAVNRALKSVRVQRVLAFANDNVMALYLWHMVPVVIVALAGYPTGLLPQPALGTSAWWLFRLQWVAILAVVAAVEIVFLYWGRRLFAAPLPTLTTPIPTALSAVLLIVGTVAIAATLTEIAILGFAPNGRLPIATATWFIAGSALIALAPSLRSTPPQRV